MDLRDLPAPPGEDEWQFKEDLKAPMWTRHAWTRIEPGPDCVELADGVHLVAGFADSAGRLDSAYEDLQDFLAAGSVTERSGGYPIETSSSTTLAHEGVNGLWLTVEFRDLVATTVTPDAGRNAERRLAKRRRTVDACARYGIQTYILCIEPRAWDADRPVPADHPERAGSTASGGRRCFCPCTDTAQDMRPQ